MSKWLIRLLTPFSAMQPISECSYKSLAHYCNQKDIMVGKTLYDKVFEDHIVRKEDEKTYLVYIDRHLIHEVTSPQAFEGLRNAGRKVRRTDCTLATVDHNIPTSSRNSYKDTKSFIQEEDSRTQVLALERNVKDFGVRYFGMTDNRQGIVHVVGPEEGFTLPGTTVVCGDSHTSTHGAFGALAFGIGTSEVEHVLATQTLMQSKSKNMRIMVNGKLAPGITSKDLMLHIIHVVGTAGGTGHVMEFAGEAIRDLSVEARMSMCNMSIEAGARAGMVAPDEKTLEYVKGRTLAPEGAEWEKALAYWNTLKSDDDAKFDTEVIINAEEVTPTITWGTSPQDALPITSTVPDPSKESDDIRKGGMERSLSYMGLQANQPLTSIVFDKVFIGSCTNSRIEDLKAAASIVKGRKIASNIKRAMVVPGSGLVKKQAEVEGLDKIFIEAGFEWREAGCSMCLGMNADILSPHERCASTSNRNFEGRQGALGRTHLMSPVMAAAAAVAGHVVDAREFMSPQMASSPKLDVQQPQVKKQKSETQNFTPEPTPEPNSINKAEEKVEQSMPEETPAQAHVNSGDGTGIPKFLIESGIAAPIAKENVVDAREFMSPQMASSPKLDVQQPQVKKQKSETQNFTPEPTPEPNSINKAEEKVEQSMPEETPAQAHVNSGDGTGIPKFLIESGIAAPIAKENVDTDAIIPKQFLKTIKRTGLAVGLFFELRNAPNDKGELQKTDFCLNVEPWTKSKILVVKGSNFGCGSSREHAPWALADFGIRSVIAPSFGDIFYNNSLKNGLLPIRLPQEVIEEKLYPIAEKGGEFSIDLPNQRILAENGDILVPNFAIDQFRKYCLVNGLDDIGITLKNEGDISNFEKKRDITFSFLNSSGRTLPAKTKKSTKLDW